MLLKCSEKMVWRHRFKFSGSGNFKLRNLHFLIDVFTYFQKKIRWTINKSKINVIDWIDYTTYACFHFPFRFFSHLIMNVQWILTISLPSRRDSPWLLCSGNSCPGHWLADRGYRLRPWSSFFQVPVQI